MHRLIDDAKIAGATGSTFFLQWSEILNHGLTLIISFATAIYVVKRAWDSFKKDKK